MMLNHVYSSRCCPLKNALRGLPVRISPGHTVVTVIRSLANSARNPSDNPTRANLLALYGKRCGMLTLPPMEAILTIRPFALAPLSAAAEGTGQAARGDLERDLTQFEQMILQDLQYRHHSD